MAKTAALRSIRGVSTSIYARSGLALTLVIGLALMSGIANAAPLAAVSPNLGVVESFSILAETNITNVPPSAIGEDVGLSPATGAGIGVTNPEVGGTIYSVDGFGPAGSVVNPGLLTTAINDMMTVFTGGTGVGLDQPCTTTFAGVQDLTLVSPLVPGVYCANAFLLTGNLTLNGNGVFIFKSAATLTTSANSTVTGGDACNVWWRLGSAATLGTNSAFTGNILAGTSIAIQTGAALNGRALAQAAVTLDQSTITGPTCLTAPATRTPTASNTPRPTNTPTPNATLIARLTATAQSLLGLPVTGFSQGVDTILAEQPEELTYASLGDLWLEIPELDLQMSIVGIPQENGNWDVSWLGDDAGWLNGTAFPTWAGNSALTGHVYDAFGDPGPFVHLSWLQYGDQAIVHAWGLAYTFEIRAVSTVSANASVSSVIKHEAYPWLTLITCSGYDEDSATYKNRVIARAVLVSIDYD